MKKKKSLRRSLCTGREYEKEIEAAGFSPIIIAGGSPSFSVHCKRPNVECSPGTFVFWDKTYLDLCPEQPFEPAALLVTRVISLPDATRICLDLGHKSVAAENEITRRVFFPEAPDLQPLSQSEEHLVLEAGPGHRYQPGDVLYGTPPSYLSNRGPLRARLHYRKRPAQRRVAHHRPRPPTHHLRVSHPRR